MNQPPSFNQFANQAPAPAPAPGYAQPGYPAQQPPQGPPGYAPPQQGFAPQGAPPGYAPQAAPMGPPQGFVPQGAPPQAQQVQQYAPAAQQYPQAPQAPQATAFGAGQFAAAVIMGGKLPCAFGTYVFQVLETGQLRDPEKGLPYWRLKCKVVEARAGVQLVNSEVTTSQGMIGDTQLKYCGSFMLQLAMATLGVNNEGELRQLLNGKYQPITGPNGQPLDGWAQLADAMQNPTTQINNCPPNPLAGLFFLADVGPGKPSKRDGKVYENWQNLRRAQ